jgi:hypothetical protein
MVSHGQPPSRAPEKRRGWSFSGSQAWLSPGPDSRHRPCSPPPPLTRAAMVEGDCAVLLRSPQRTTGRSAQVAAFLASLRPTRHGPITQSLRVPRDVGRPAARARGCRRLPVHSPPPLPAEVVPMYLLPESGSMGGAPVLR